MLDEYTNGDRFELSRYFGPGEGRFFLKSGKPRKKVAHSFHYSHLDANPQGRFFIPDLLSFGDYDNSGTVERSNNRVFREQFASLEGREWWVVHGGFGQGIVLRIDADERDENIREFFEGLENYPVADDDAHSEFEMEQENANWTDYGIGDFITQVVRWLPEGIDERVREVLEHRDAYSLFHAMSEVTNLMPEHEGTATLFHEEEMAWRTLAKATPEECEQFAQLVEDEATRWDYGGNGYAFLRMLNDRQVPFEQMVMFAWERFGRSAFQYELVHGFYDVWGRTGEADLWEENPDYVEGTPGAGVTSPARMRKLPPRTPEQLESLMRSVERLREMWPGGVDLLFWNLLRPIWDAQNTEQYQHAIQGYWAKPITFNVHWMTRHFDKLALTDPFLVLLDALDEGNAEAVQAFYPIFFELMNQKNKTPRLRG